LKWEFDKQHPMVTMDPAYFCHEIDFVRFTLDQIDSSIFFTSML
jgi:hypothetical protein